jgi:hypothetical protein
MVDETSRVSLSRHGNAARIGEELSIERTNPCEIPILLT